MTRKNDVSSEASKPSGKQEQDSRFQRVAKDPRFWKPRKQHAKVKIDARFQGAFNDPAFTRPYSVDKYGRKLDTRDSAKREMERFYRLDEEAAAGRGDENSGSPSGAVTRDSTRVDSDISSDESVEDDFSSSSSSESDTSASEDSEDGLDTTVLDEAFDQHPLVNTSVAVGDATRRLAIVNADWDQLKAVDLFVLISAFKPPIGIVHSVKIYPSDFGKERMAREAVEGPPRAIFKREDAPSDASEADTASDSDSDADCNPLKDLAGGLVEEAGQFDQGALRRYQLERLRYYYAIVECDSAATAAVIYHNCDGREFETSTNTLDLRYVPDDTVFSDADVTDMAKTMPKKYTPKPTMVTGALQQSSVSLTWDQDDPDRRRVTRANYGRVDYEEADLRAYLASSSDEESDAENVEFSKPAQKESKDDRISRYRALLLSGGNKSSGSVFGRSSHEDTDQLDITFTSGMLDKMEGEVSGEEGGEVSGEEGGEVSGEEREVSGEEALESSSDESSSEEDGGRVAVFDQDGNIVTKLDKSSDESKRAKPVRHDKPEKFVLTKDWSKGKKTTGQQSDASSAPKTKKKMHKRESDLLVADPAFQVNLDDTRFSAVFDMPDYAIDPTAPAFRKTQGMEQLVAERQRRKRVAEDAREASRGKRSK